MRRKQHAVISLVLAGVLCAGNISSAVYAGEAGIIEDVSVITEETESEETEASCDVEDLMICEDEDGQEEEVYDNFMEEELSVAEDSGDADIVEEGVCGTNVKWKLDANGKLTVYSGSDTPQPMSDYSDGQSPFSDDERIETVVIGPNVSSIGAYAFSGCCCISSMELQSSVYDINGTAFQWCDSLSSIILSEDNNHFAFKEGVLYNREFTKLIFCIKRKDSVVIPDTVKQIGPFAFAGCSNLSSITIPDSVTEIGVHAFDECTNLSSITIPDSVKELGEYSFNNCRGLTSVVISNSVTEIGAFTFWDCEGLTSVTVPDSVSVLGKYAFGRCKKIKEVNLSNNLTTISEAAFGACESLKTIRIPESVQEIGIFAFTNCGLEEFIFPHGVSVIEGNIFSNCYHLRKVFIPDTITEIKTSAFRNCSSLRKLYIPQSVRNNGIETGAFSEHLETVLYGYKESYAEKYAEVFGLPFSQVFYHGIVSFDEEKNVWIDEDTGRFWEYDSKQSAYHFFDPSVNEWVSAAAIAGDGSDYSTFLISYSNGMAELIVAADNNTIGEEDPVELDPIGEDNKTGRCGPEVTWTLDEQGVLTIDGTGRVYEFGPQSSPFYNSPLIRSVIIGEGVTNIGAYMFHLCKNLESISIPDQVSKIGKEAFGGCISLESITVPAGVKVVYDDTYSGCVNLSEVKYLGDISYIGEGAFLNCKKLEALPSFKSVEAIRSIAFQNCDGLKEISIPEGVQIIDYYAFSGCKNVRSVAIPKSVSAIVTPFSGCSQLESFDVDPENIFYKSSDGIIYSKDGKSLVMCPPAVTELSLLDGTTQIRDWAFYDCRIKNIDNFGSVERIGTCAFCRCTELLQAPISSVTKYIGNEAFSHCSSLEGVSLSDSVTKIGQRAFAECDNLSDVRLPGNITELPASLFWGCRSLVSIEIPQTVALIGNCAFAECSNLTKVLFGSSSSLSHIGEYAFRNCIVLSGIALPSEVTAVDQAAFSGCWNLGEIWIPDHLTDIGKNAFRDCYDIKIIRYQDQDFDEASSEYEKHFSIDLYNDENGRLIDDQGNEYYYDEENTELYRLDGSGGKIPVREYYRQKLIQEGYTASEVDDFFAADIIEYHRATPDNDEDILSAASISDLSVRGRYAFFIRRKKYVSATADKQKRAQTALNKSTKTSSRPTVRISYRGTIYMTAGKKLRGARVYGMKSGDSVLKWKSSKTTVVRVNSKTGMLTAKKKGTAAITVTTRYGARASFIVKVTKPTVRLSKKRVTMQTGTSTMVAVSMVSGDRISSVKSSKKKVVRVVRLGKSIYLIARKKGTAKITVRTKYGGKKTLKVIVKKAK